MRNCKFLEKLHPNSAFGPATIFLTSKIICLLIPSPTQVSYAWTWESKKSEPTDSNHLDQSIYLANQEQGLDCVSVQWFFRA